jgi:hypothetical protein
VKYPEETPISVAQHFLAMTNIPITTRATAFIDESGQNVITCSIPTNLTGDYLNIAISSVLRAATIAEHEVQQRQIESPAVNPDGSNK